MATAKNMKLQDFRLEIKEVSESGVFTGFASVYGVTDLGGDIVERGAFNRTLKDRSTVPILWQHVAPIGLGELQDSEKGLIVKGRLTLDVGAAREALALVKDGVVRGLSIGFTTVKDSIADGIRHLHEIKLWEVSLVTFPMLPVAQVTSVKKAGDMERKMDFNEAVDKIETMRGMYTSMEALEMALYDCLYDEKLSTDDYVSNIETAIGQFSEKMTELVPKVRMLLNATYGYDFKKLFEIERKAGRKISAASRSKIEDAIKQLQALLEEEPADSEEAGSTTSPETKGSPTPGAAAPQAEPAYDHSALQQFQSELKGLITWQN